MKMNVMQALTPVCRFISIFGLNYFECKNDKTYLVNSMIQRLVTLTIFVSVTGYLCWVIREKYNYVMSPHTALYLIGFDLMNIILEYAIVVAVLCWTSLYKTDRHGQMLGWALEADELLGKVVQTKKSSLSVWYPMMRGLPVVVVVAMSIVDVPVARKLFTDGTATHLYLFYVASFYSAIAGLYVCTLLASVTDRFDFIHEFLLSLDVMSAFQESKLELSTDDVVSENVHVQKEIMMLEMIRSCSRAHSKLADILDELSLVYGPLGVIFLLKVVHLAVQMGFFLVTFLAGVDLVDMEEQTTSFRCTAWIFVYGLMAYSVIKACRDCCETGNRTSGIITQILMRLPLPTFISHQPSVRDQLIGMTRQVETRPLDITTHKIASVNYCLFLPIMSAVVILFIMVIQINLKYRAPDEDEGDE